MCKKIHRGGNAEQYHANKKYKEAVAVAVEKCAGSPRDEVVEAVAILEELTLTARRVYGPSHPQTKLFEHHFELSKSDPRLVVRAPSV